MPLAVSDQKIAPREAGSQKAAPACERDGDTGAFQADPGFQQPVGQGTLLAVGPLPAVIIRAEVGMLESTDYADRFPAVETAHLTALISCLLRIRT